MSLFDDASLVLTPNGYKASKLYSIKPTSGLGDMTVVRATTARRVNSAGLIESVATNVPRLDYTGSSCPSILVEPQRTNLVLRSEDLSNAYWTKTNVTITANSITSPIASFNSDLIVENSASNVVFGVNASPRPSGLTIGTTYSVSFFAKKITRDWCYFYDFNTFQLPVVQVYFNLSTGLVGTSTLGVLNPKMENYGNGWYRCSFQFVATAGGTSIDYRIAAATSDNTLTYSGTIGQQSISVTACQLETGSNATSYIPTVAATATRNADVISKTGISSLIGQTEGTVFVELNLTNVLARAIFGLDIGATTNYIAGTTNSTNAVRLVVSSAGSATTLITTSTLAIGFYKIAFAYKSGDYAIYINGVSAGTSLSTTFPIGTLSQFVLSSASYGALNDSYNSATLFPTRLTNAQLATLTTI